MVGIVIVSHSSKIAEGVVDLCRQMANPELKLLAAGGTADGGIGTDATKILAAIQEANSGDGVVVLCDLGSAIISTETALDFLDDKTNILVADAPLVEGAVVATVEASIGSKVEKVKETAEEARNLHKLM